MSTLSDLGASNAAITTKTLTSSTGVVYVNSIYPYGIGPIGSTQTPQSLGYTTIADYISALPSAYQSSVTSFSGYVPAITDECDLIAWQTATNYIYDTGDQDGGLNQTCGHIIAYGGYLVNKTITFNHSAIWIEGGTPNMRLRGTWVKNTATTGTVSLPVPAFDFYLFDEFGLPPPGRLNNGVQSGGLKVIVENIDFYGNASNSIPTPSLSGYLSGCRIRKASFAQVANCSFANNLYDGLYFTDAQLFCIVERNFFYGCTRDAVAILQNYAAQIGSSGTATFSTTVWIYNNEFGLQGRYAILMDLADSIEAMPILRDNSFEGTISTSYYLANPEWFVHGVKSTVCILGGGNLISRGHRAEGDTIQGCESTFHMVGGVAMSHADMTGSNIYFTAYPSSSSLTITGITQANPGVVTYTGTDLFSENDHVYISGVLGMKAVNGREFKISNLNTSTNTFELFGVDTSGYGAYSSGGTVTMRSRTEAAVRSSGWFDIQDITQANPGVVTYAGTVPFVNGNTIRIDASVGGMTQVRSTTFTVANLNVSAKTFELSGVNTSGYTAYTVGGRIATSAANAYLDISNDRNYNCNGPGNVGSSIEQVEFRNIYNLRKILFSEITLIGGTTPWTLDNVVTLFWTVPTQAGTYARMVQPLTTAVAAQLINPVNVIYLQASGGDGRVFGHYSSVTNSGDYSCNGVAAPTWAASTAYYNTFDSAVSVYNTRQNIQPTTSGFTGMFYRCTTSGTSGTSEPVWGSVINGTTADSGVIWTCIAVLYGYNNVLTYEQMELGKRITSGASAPTTGRWAVGDRRTNSSPVGGGTIGWVNTTAGIPGTWRAWGAIS